MSTTPGERRALLFLGAIAALGAGTKLLRSDESAATPASIEALQRQISVSESVAAEQRSTKSGGSRSRKRRLTDADAEGREQASLPYDARIRPLTDAELAGGRSAPSAPHTSNEAAAAVQAKLNVNLASAAELQRLPGIGPALAERIVQHRTGHGPFTGPEDLDRVRGIGPAMLARIGPLVTF